MTASSSRPRTLRSPAMDRPWCEPRSTSCVRSAVTTRAVRGASTSSTTGRPAGRRATSAPVVKTAPTFASRHWNSISAGAASGFTSTAPRPSLAASAVRYWGDVGRRMAERLPLKARTRGALRWSKVSPAATSCWASKTSPPPAPMRPPPAARARGSRASGSLTSACGRAGASDLEAPERVLQPLADVGQVLARRGHAGHRRRLLLHDRAHLLGGGGVRLRRRRKRLDLLRQRLGLAALGVGCADDAIDGLTRRRDLTIDLGQRLGRSTDDGLAGGHAVARLNDLLLGADGARADLGGQLPDLVERSSTLRRELAHLVRHYRETLAMLPRARRFDRRVECEEVGLARDGPDGVGDLADALRLLAELHDGGDRRLGHVGDGHHRGERFVGGDGA